MDNTSACPPDSPVASTIFVSVRGQDYYQRSLDERKKGREKENRDASQTANTIFFPLLSPTELFF